MTESAQRMYTKYRELAEENDECPLCNRHFPSKDKNTFILKLEEMLAEVPRAIEKNMQSLKEQNSLLFKLKKLQPEYDTMMRLQEKDIPAAQKSLGELQDEQDQLENETSQLEKKVEELKRAEEDVTSLMSDVTVIVKSHQESLQLEQEVEKEEKKLKSISSDVRTVDDVSAEYDQFQLER